MSTGKPLVKVYTSGFCPYCLFTKRLLNGKGVSYEEIRVDESDNLRGEMERRSGRRSVPQIFIGDRHVGGYDDMTALDRRGELDSLLGLS
jgi:glutaredoxin 3